MNGDETKLRTIWKRQNIPLPELTPAQLAARASQFDRDIRNRQRRDSVSFALVALAAAFAIATISGLLVKVGGSLLLGWSLYSIWGLRHFGAALEPPAGAEESTCSVWYQRQLERQRDIALSWPLGIGLALPGFVLMTVGLARPERWEVSAALIGCFVTVYLALIVYGRVRAAGWQQEIDALRSTREN